MPPLFEEIPALDEGLELREASYEKPGGRERPSPLGAYPRHTMPVLDDPRKHSPHSRPHQPPTAAVANQSALPQQTGLMGSPPIKLWRLFR